MDWESEFWCHVWVNWRALLHSRGPESRWRGGRVVEGAALEMLYRGNSIEGSNPSLSVSGKSDTVLYGMGFLLERSYSSRLLALSGCHPSDAVS